MPMSFFKRLSILLLLFGVGAGVSYGQEATQIEQALAAGNTEALAKFFENSVELSLLREENIYARQQATVVLEAFFKKHPPQSFSISHNNSRGDNTFLIGNLQIRGGGAYRVTIFLKGEAKQRKIKRLQIAES